MHRGLFINFEGIDKSGKGTQINMLAEKLRAMGQDFVISVEPTDQSDAGKKILRVLAKEIPAPSAKELQLLYSEDRGKHVVDLINPTLTKGIMLLEDRYFFSTLAYGIAFGVDYDFLKKANSEYPIPDITFYIKISAAEAMRRLNAEQGKAEYFEKEEKLALIKDSYEKVFTDWPNIVVIDGERSPEEIHQEIWQIINKKLAI